MTTRLRQASRALLAHHAVSLTAPPVLYACSLAQVCVAYVRHMPHQVRPAETERHVRLFRNGRNQAVRIPRDLELPGREAILRREGQRLVVEPVSRPSLLAVLATLKPLDDDFPRIERLAAEPVDL